MLHKPSLQIAISIESFGKDTCQLPDGSMTWKHFRLSGIHIVQVFAYFQHSIGLTDANLEKVHLLDALCDGGPTKVICCGDWKCSPAQ